MPIKGLFLSLDIIKYKREDRPRRKDFKSKHRVHCMEEFVLEMDSVEAFQHWFTRERFDSMHKRAIEMNPALDCNQDQTLFIHKCEFKLIMDDNSYCVNETAFAIYPTKPGITRVLTGDVYDERARKMRFQDHYAQLNRYFKSSLEEMMKKELTVSKYGIKKIYNEDPDNFPALTLKNITASAIKRCFSETKSEEDSVDKLPIPTAISTELKQFIVDASILHFPQINYF